MRILVTDIFIQQPDDTPSSKVMVVGASVTTVQRLSRYCLQQGIEVFPYYGVPTTEEVTLFCPDALIVCLPVPENFFLQIDQPFILWSEPTTVSKLPVASTHTQLATLLQQTLQN